MNISLLDYMQQNGHNSVAFDRKYMLLLKLDIFMETVTDGTRTDFVQFTQIWLEASLKTA